MIDSHNLQQPEDSSFQDVSWLAKGLFVELRGVRGQNMKKNILDFASHHGNKFISELNGRHERRQCLEPLEPFIRGRPNLINGPVR